MFVLIDLEKINIIAILLTHKLIKIKKRKKKKIIFYF